MSLRYEIAPGVTWVDAVDCGRELGVVWIARLDTADLFELRDAAWMVWWLVAEGTAEPDAIRDEIARAGASVDFGDAGLEGFLTGLEDNGLLVSSAGGSVLG